MIDDIQLPFPALRDHVFKGVYELPEFLFLRALVIRQQFVRFQHIRGSLLSAQLLFSGLLFVALLIRFVGLLVLFVPFFLDQKWLGNVLEEVVLV